MAARIRRERPGVHFVLIGEGELRAELERSARASGLIDAVHFTGFRSDVERIMPELDVMAMTSRTEGLGTAVLDAFACRVPVVATAAGRHPRDGRT
jgi:glycosyltransferase involved in cell wall biosynthesis